MTAPADTLTEAKVLEAYLKVYWPGPVFVRESAPEFHPDRPGEPTYLMLEDVLNEHGGQKTLICHPNNAARLLASLRGSPN